MFVAFFFVTIFRSLLKKERNTIEINFFGVIAVHYFRSNQTKGHKEVSKHCSSSKLSKSCQNPEMAPALT